MISFSFHWTYLIVLAGVFAIPICIYKMSSESDRFGVGSLLGFLIGSIICLLSIVIFMSVKLWMIS